MMSGVDEDKFKYPWQYSFPPFFTLQPHAETRKKQLESWRSLVLDYCQRKGITTLEPSESCDLFHNREIDRKLPESGISEVFGELQKCGNVEWIDKGKRKCYVYWRSPGEWGDIIYNYARENGLNRGGICTFYELTESEDVVDQPFYNLNKDLLVKSLKTLEENNKAELFNEDDGVKFF